MSAFTVADVIRRSPIATSDASRVALISGEHRLTYAELDERTDRLAVAWRSAGFSSGDRIGLLMGNRVEWIEIFFAVAKLGGVVVPLNHLLSAGELAAILDDCDARWVASEPAFAETAHQLAPGRRLVSIGPAPAGALDLDELRDTRADPATHAFVAQASADDLVLLQYTSGTTGTPKGVMHTHTTVMWNSYHQLLDYQLTELDVWLTVPALCWAAGLHDLTLATLWSGGTVVLGPTSGFDPVQLLATIERERVTGTLLVPTVLRRVLATGSIADYDLTSLRHVLSGGEPVPQSALEHLSALVPSCEVSQVYGMSEFPTLMLRLSPGDAAGREGSTGKACSIATVRVVGEKDVDVKAGEIGEIICRSPATMRGYWGKPTETEATLKDGWLRTGDLARLDADGFVFVVGRSKDMIITGGLNVYPAEVERAIAEHPAVVEAAVVGRPDPEWGEVGAAIVVLNVADALDAATLTAYLRERVAGFKVPRTFEFTMTPLPRTTSGKVQKFML
jgi:fatty-acyl-CoA synthase